MHFCGLLSAADEHTFDALGNIHRRRMACVYVGSTPNKLQIPKFIITKEQVM